MIPDHVLRRLYPDTETVGPASIDLHLGDKLLRWPQGVLRDPRRDQTYEWRKEPLINGDWILRPDIRYLAATAERIEIRPDCAGQIAARSSWGRDGLAVICGPAGFLDPGYEGHPTLELSVVGSELILWPGASICQLILHRLTAVCERPYQGRYQDDREPTASRLHLEGYRVRGEGQGGVTDNDEAMKISDAIVYGWSSGVSRMRHTALRPYVRHIGDCAVPADAVPDNGFCSCGLRSVWRIRETPEARAVAACPAGREQEVMG